MGLLSWFKPKLNPEVVALQTVLAGFAEYCEQWGIQYQYSYDKGKVRISIQPYVKGAGEYLTTYRSGHLRDFLHAVDILESVLGDIEIRQTDGMRLEAIVEIGG